MSEYQVTYWRDLPSLVVARDGDEVTKAPLPPRFQEAVDEAGTTTAVVDRVVADLETEWSTERIAAYLDDLGGATT